MLIVKTNEEKSVIELNNKFLGYGKIETRIDTGKYILSVHEPYEKLDSKYILDTLNVSYCNDIKLSYNFNSAVYLKTNPQDVYVYSRDSLLGSTPLFVPVKYDRVELSKPGYKSKLIRMNQLKSNNLVNLKYTGENVTKSFYEKDIFKILVGTMVLLGGTTAYFKLKADNRYDSYLSTDNQAYLDQTKKYDTISGITMTALQINFGILIYYFLTD
ncbi:MAG: hypothetical protein P8Z35_04880 [Ignavibacteriaceae bacterium]